MSKQDLFTVIYRLFLAVASWGWVIVICDFSPPEQKRMTYSQAAVLLVLLTLYVEEMMVVWGLSFDPPKLATPTIQDYNLDEGGCNRCTGPFTKEYPQCSCCDDCAYCCRCKDHLRKKRKPVTSEQQADWSRIWKEIYTTPGKCGCSVGNLHHCFGPRLFHIVCRKCSLCCKCQNRGANSRTYLYPGRKCIDCKIPFIDCSCVSPRVDCRGVIYQDKLEEDV